MCKDIKACFYAFVKRKYSCMAEPSSLYFSPRYGKRSAQEDVVAELLFGSDNNREQRSR